MARWVFRVATVWFFVVFVWRVQAQAIVCDGFHHACKILPPCALFVGHSNLSAGIQRLPAGRMINAVIRLSSFRSITALAKLYPTRCRIVLYRTYIPLLWFACVQRRAGGSNDASLSFRTLGKQSFVGSQYTFLPVYDAYRLGGCVITTGYYSTLRPYCRPGNVPIL